MKNVTNDLRDSLKKLTQDVYNKIKRCRHTVKAAWKRLDYLEDHVEKIYQDIDVITENLVRCIAKLLSTFEVSY